MASYREKRSLDTKDDKKTTKRTKDSMGTRVTVGSGKKKTKKVLYDDINLSKM